MTDIDTSPEAVEWPREIWAEERGEHDYDARHVFSERSTVPRWEGDRDKDFHRYIDADILESAEKYYAAQLFTLRASLATAQEQAQTARDDALREAIALCDWDTSESELFALENKLRGLIQTTEPRPDAAKEE